MLDCGAFHTTAIPIHDGYVLNKAVAQSPLGGDFITSKCRMLLEDHLNIEIVPYYMVKSKVSDLNLFLNFLGHKKCLSNELGSDEAW